MRGRWLVLVLTVVSWGTEVRAQDNTAFAQQRFTRGTALYDSHDYARALDEFRASVALYGSPNTRLYVARCLRELARLDEALPEFERAVHEAADRAQSDPRYAATRDAARAELLALEPRVGRLTVNVPDVPTSAHVRVAGREVPLAGLGVAIPVLPGSVAILVEAEGYVPDRREVSVAAGRETGVEIHLQRRAVLEGHTETPWRVGPNAVTGVPGPLVHPATGVPRAVAWTAFAVGAAGLAGFAVFGLLANGRFNDLQSACGMTTCPPDRRDDVAGGRTFQTLTNVSLAVGLVGAASGGIFWLLGHPARTESPAGAVRVGVSGTGVIVHGVF